LCGIVGVYRQAEFGGREAPLMLAALAHRGPDGSGVWRNPCVWIGHHRLATTELRQGQQPLVVRMQNTKVVVAFNGVIENYRELAEELSSLGHVFRHRSDTEVIAHSFLEWGPNFERLEGMFAISLWDERSQKLYLSRDRLGVKPLIYFNLPDGVAFASEEKALLKHPDIAARCGENELREIVSDVQSGEVHILRGFHNVPVGTTLEFALGQPPITHRYWRLPTFFDKSTQSVEQLRILLTTSTRQHLRIDRPAALLLSGGLDSSVLAALCSSSTGDAALADAYTLPGGEDGQLENSPMVVSGDERYARLVARSCSLKLHVLRIPMFEPTWKHDLVLPVLACDDPTAFGEYHASLLGMFRQIDRSHRVLIAGEGADEVFGGYSWSLPSQQRSANLLPWMSHQRDLASDADLAYSPLDLKFIRSLRLLEYEADVRSRLASERTGGFEGDSDEVRRNVMRLALLHYLPRLLKRMDRLSMAVGIEVRLPYLTRRLVEYVYSCPPADDPGSKGLLRSLARSLLPLEVAERPKSAYPTFGKTATYREQLLTLLQEELSDDLGHYGAPLVSIKGVRLLLANPDAINHRILRRHVEVLLGFATWRRAYNVSVI
jgi:asparagine synthase (glutamine-hydrolysing)